MGFYIKPATRNNWDITKPLYSPRMLCRQTILEEEEIVLATEKEMSLSVMESMRKALQSAYDTGWEAGYANVD